MVLVLLMSIAISICLLFLSNLYKTTSVYYNEQVGSLIKEHNTRSLESESSAIGRHSEIREWLFLFGSFRIHCCYFI